MAESKPVKNHVIIGLGGTGGKVLREMRKRVYEEFRSNEPDKVYLEYLYVDSSPTDLEDRAGWKVMGKSVHLLEAEKVSIHGVSASMFQNLSMYPGLKCFLNAEDVSLMTSKLGPLVTAGIGGQRRRLGRTLFANNLSVKNNNSDFVSRLKGAVDRITRASGDVEVTFHICAGLAGGTGSGSVVDAISQIRKTYPPQPGKDIYKVFLYLYVPEMNVANARHDAGFYQANGYAALCELNAMSVHRYLPYDVAGEKDIFTGEVQRLLGDMEPFEAAYLYTNVNEKGKILDIAQALPQRVADFLFQKIVAAVQVENGQMGRLVGCENDGAGAENDYFGEAVRSRKFLTFGIQRIEYPETEIKEFVIYNLARQTARQMQFNYWQEGVGYGEGDPETIGANFKNTVETESNRGIWMLSDSYLTLSKAIEESQDTSRWEDIESTWRNRTEEFANDVQTSSDKEGWWKDFTEMCEEFYDATYRSHGVRKSYEIQRGKIMEANAKYIRRHIEKWLFKAWEEASDEEKERPRSIWEAEKFTYLLIADCEKRIGEFKKRIDRLEKEQGLVNDEIDDCKDEWDHIGWLRDAFTGKSQKVFSAYKTALCQLYVLKTHVVACSYAVELLQAVVEQLNEMLNGIVLLKQRLGEILEEMGKKADSRCKENGDDEILKKYDPEMVHRVVKSYGANHDIQKVNALNVRKKMVALLGEEGKRTFANLHDNIDYDSIVGIVLEECDKTARKILDENDPQNKMLGVNILEKLKQEYNSEEKLEAFVRSLVQSAASYLEFNPEEQAKVFTDNGGEMMPMLQLCLPAYNEDKSGFRNKLIEMFVKLAPGFKPEEDVAENYKSNQIVLVSAAAGFPLRYVANVKVLKQRYDAMLAAPDKELNRMVLHTETFAKPLPAVFELTQEDLRRMVTPSVMLGYAMGLFEEKSDPTTGERFHAVGFPDEFGDINWERLGKNIIHTLDRLSENFGLSKRIMDLVERKLKQEYRSNDQKVALRQSLLNVLKTQILPHPVCENNEFSPVYQQYKAIAKKIFENELKEL